MTRGRRAQQFHELVEGSSPVGASVPRYADLLEVVGALRVVPEPVPDPAFVAALRDRLLAEAEAVLVAAAAERDDTDARLRLRPTTRPTAPRTRHRPRRLAAVVSGVVLAGASATMAVAAQSALPGEALYPVKRGLENAQAELTFDRADRGRLILHDAGTRLDEVQELSRDQADASRVDDALTAFTQQAITGSDLLIADYDTTGDRASMTSVRTFASTSMNRLRLLQSEVPPQSLDALLQAAQAVEQVQQTALQTCPSCAGPLITSAPSVLLQAVRTTSDSWAVAVPRPHHHAVAQGADGGPQLPHLPATLPPASVTDPGSAPGDDPTEPTAPSSGDVQHTVQHLTDGLTSKQQDDVASTVSDTTNNLLDAVGDVGNQVAGAVDGTIGGTVGGTVGDVQSLLPTLP